MDLRRAYSTFAVKAADDDTGIIEGIASTPSVDRIGDIVEPMGAQYKLPLPLLWQHHSGEPIGHVIAAKITDEGIAIKAKIAKGLLPEIDRAWALIKGGLVRGLSIGFKPIESADIKGTWGQRFIKWDWLELSAVTIPANADASIQAIKSLDEEYLRAAKGLNVGAQHRVRLASTPGASGTGIITLTKEGNMNIKEQIAAYEAKRAATQAAMEAIIEASAKEGATLSKEQGDEYEGLKSELEQVDTHLKRLRDHESMLAKTAKPVTSDAGQDNAAPGQKTDSVRYGDARIKLPDLPKGTAFVRFACAVAQSKGSLAQAMEIGKRWKDSTPQVANLLEVCYRAGTTHGWGRREEGNGDVVSHLRSVVAPGTTQDANWASPLVQYDNMASEFVEYLRPRTIIGRLNGLRRVPFNIRFPSQSSGSTMYWSGEGTPKKVSKLQLSTNTLGFAKAAGIVVITQELARLSSPSAENLVREDMASSMVAFLDAQFIDPGVAASANVNPASITNGLTSQNQATGSTLATFEVDAAAAMAVLVNANIPFESLVWITTPYTAMKIGMLRDAGGAVAFPGVTMAGGTLYGVPLVTSNSVPNSVSAGTIMVLAAQPEIFLADEGGIEIDASDQASLELNDAPTASGTTGASLVSLWQENLLGIRCERYINWQRRRTAAVTYIDNLHL